MTNLMIGNKFNSIVDSFCSRIRNFNRYVNRNIKLERLKYTLVWPFVMPLHLNYYKKTGCCVKKIAGTNTVVQISLNWEITLSL